MIINFPKFAASIFYLSAQYLKQHQNKRLTQQLSYKQTTVIKPTNQS
jgi:hypothetical protein